MTKKPDVLSMNPDELKILMTELKQPSYRGLQIFEWLHRRGAENFSEMSDLPKDLRQILANTCYISPCRMVKTHRAKGAEKYIFSIAGQENYSSDEIQEILIESVMMEYSHGSSVCISTQAGCRMNCSFCASGRNGLIRNLTPGEMCTQVYAAAKNSGKQPRGVLLMGSGEPLDNMANSLKFLELITHIKGANIGSRHITLSTCGLAPQIRELASKKLQINLAVSLHAPTDEIRQKLMPIAKRYPIKEIISACRYYFNQTHRRVTFEYTLIKGVNDNLTQAKDLSNLLRGFPCHVNLIPVNPGKKETSLSPTSRKGAEAFANILNENRIPATIRRTLGSEVAAACGQLLSSVAVESDCSNV